MSAKPNLKHMNATELESEILRLNMVYYNTGISPIPDLEYDFAKRQLREMNPDAAVLKMVGAPVPAGDLLTEAEHKIHMGSVANALNKGELVAWHTKQNPLQMVASLKVDGSSLDLEYADGRLVKAITRGTGIIGQDVTFNVIQSQNLPGVLNAVNWDGKLENFTGSIRGEILLTIEDWKKIDPDSPNPRNAAAGLVRRKSNSTNARYLTFLAHDIAWPGHTIKSWADAFDYMEGLGFDTPTHATFNSVEALEAWHTEIDEGGREKLPYEVDGIVVAIRDMIRFKDLGIDGENCPRGQIAWKFTTMKASTILTGITLTVGHTGAINPTAVLKPVQVGGVEVKAASLSNFNEIKRLNVRIGDQVIVGRQGDVIPKVLQVDLVLGDEEIKEPTMCPVCNGSVGRKKVKGKKKGEMVDGAVLYCLSPDCEAKPAGKIKRWGKSLKIDGLGDGVIEALVSTVYHDLVKGDSTRVPGSKVVETPADLYRLKEIGAERLGEMKLKGKRFGVSNATSLIAEIDKHRELTMDDFIGSLGLPFVGKGKAENIIKADIMLGSNLLADDVRHWFSHYSITDTNHVGGRLESYADELGIPGIAKTVQVAIDAAKPLIEDLQYAGVKILPYDKPDAPAADAKLLGKSFCFTTCRPTDDESAKLLSLGGEEKSGVSAGLSYLVQKDKTKETSKSKKAAEVGTPVISYEEFQGMLS